MNLLNQPPIIRLRGWTGLRLYRRLQRSLRNTPLTLRQVTKARVLVVATHLGEEILAAGGTLAQHEKLGSHVAVAYCCGNERGGSTEKAEAETVAQTYAFADLWFLDFPRDKLARHEYALARELAQMIRELWPAQIFCPWLVDRHPDRATAVAAVAAALRKTHWEGEIWCYERETPAWVNTAVDISDTLEAKRAALNRYRTVLTDARQKEASIALARYRSLPFDAAYVESFSVMRASQFLALSKIMDGR